MAPTTVHTFDDTGLDRLNARYFDYGGGYGLLAAPDSDGKMRPLRLEVPVGGEDGAHIASTLAGRFDEAADLSVLPGESMLLEEASAEEDYDVPGERDPGVKVTVDTAPVQVTPERLVVVQYFDEFNARQIVDTLARLDREDKKAPIVMDIASCGGSVHGMQSIINTANVLRAPVYTLCRSKAMSAGAYLLALGAPKGNRIVGEAVEVMVHEVISRARGNLRDLKADVAAAEKMQDEMYRLLGERTNLSADEWRDRIVKNPDQVRDHFFTSAECVELGLADAVMGSDSFEKIVAAAGAPANTPVDPWLMWLFFEKQVDGIKAKMTPGEKPAD